MVKTLLLSVILLLGPLAMPATTLAATMDRDREAQKKDLEVVEIDGTAHPELIPQWSAWEFAFRMIAGGQKLLPSVVHHVVSKEDAAVILREAEGAQVLALRCEKRMGELRTHIGREKPAWLRSQAWAITLDYRTKVLEARDRLRMRLPSEGWATLSAFVESTKAGTSVTLTRKQLVEYRLPE